MAEVYEQPDEPTSAGVGALWIDTDALLAFDPTQATGTIADFARGELPQEWDALQREYGDLFMARKIASVMAKLFGSILTVDEQGILDVRVLDYCGKIVALEMINPAISYWSKQAVTIGARGQNETKSYKDRAEDLILLRKWLLEQTRLMQAEVWPLLPNRKVDRNPKGPVVRQAIGAVTPDPDDFERPFALPEELTEGGATI
jgi:hypothetical protein